MVIASVHRRGKTARVPPDAGAGAGGTLGQDRPGSVPAWVPATTSGASRPGKRCEKLALLCSGREFTCDICSLATEGDRGGARRGDPTQLEKIEAEIRKELAALSVSWVPAYERRSCG